MTTTPAAKLIDVWASLQRHAVDHPENMRRYYQEKARTLGQKAADPSLPPNKRRFAQQRLEAVASATQDFEQQVEDRRRERAAEQAAKLAARRAQHQDQAARALCAFVAVLVVASRTATTRRRVLTSTRWRTSAREPNGPPHKTKGGSPAKGDRPSTPRRRHLHEPVLAT